MVKKRRRKIRYDRVGYICILLFLIVAGIFLLFNKHSFDKKAIWLSYIDMETLKDQEEEAFTSAFEEICDTIKEQQLNTIIVQVRAFQDAIYPSAYYPSATYMTSQTNFSYDPLKIMIEIAHQNDIKIEAWINPYRISYNKDQFDYFSKYHLKSEWINTTHILRNGYQAILNPASQEVITYITDGVKEIIDHYEVDGIHMDDYFYTDWAGATITERKTNINKMITSVYQTIKNKEEAITFGVSPQGNLENCRNAGADIDTWLAEEGYVDYLMPQIYWTDHWAMNGSIPMFSNRLEEWSSLKSNSVDLYAGLALYLAGKEVKDDAGWHRYNDNLKQQIEKLSKQKWQGYSFFSYTSIFEKSAKSELENIN